HAREDAVNKQTCAPDIAGKSFISNAKAAAHFLCSKARRIVGWVERKAKPIASRGAKLMMGFAPRSILHGPRNVPGGVAEGRRLCRDGGEAPAAPAARTRRIETGEAHHDQPSKPLSQRRGGRACRDRWRAVSASERPTAGARWRERGRQRPRWR